MEDFSERPDAVLPADDELVKKGHPVLAWALIILLVAITCFLQQVHSEQRSESEGGRFDLIAMELQGKFIVGMPGFLRKTMTEAEIKGLDIGSLDRRFCYVVLEGELSGPTKALTLLRQLDEKVGRAEIVITPEQGTVESILHRLYSDHVNGRWEAPSLSQADRELLIRDLSWFGKLALHPAGGVDQQARQAVLYSAQRFAWLFLTEIMGLGLLCLAGFVGLLVALVLFLTGKWRGGLGGGTPYGGIYAETFAVWMALFLALNVGAGFVPAGKSSLLVLGLASLGSLSALAWPLLRGVSWRQVRLDLGLNRGTRPAVEPAMGLAGYAMTLPLLVLGLIIFFILIQLQHWLGGNGVDVFPLGQPVHPVVQYAAGEGWWGPLQLVLVASLVAPIVEETMFRGVLYRHLREASAKWGMGLSILVSGAVTSFIFAVIHPQGLLAVPPLMALAFGFSLIREWRGSLLPCMVAHGLHNGLITLTLVVALK